MNPKLAELIQYAESALRDDHPFEVTGDDLQIVLDALRAVSALNESGHNGS